MRTSCVFKDYDYLRVTYNRKGFLGTEITVRLRRQVGHHEAWVGPTGGMLGLHDHPPRPIPGDRETIGFSQTDFHSPRWRFRCPDRTGHRQGRDDVVSWPHLTISPNISTPKPCRMTGKHGSRGNITRQSPRTAAFAGNTP